MNPHRPLPRRSWLMFVLAAWVPPALADTIPAAALLRQGGVVVLMRHALAPGTFDPPEFELGNCSTQRLLSEEGRAQSRRIGAWFLQQQLLPRQVLSSPWCRCLDTATLAFGTAQSWAALGSPHGGDERRNAQALQSLRQALAAVPAGRFDVWVTHDFVINALVGASASSGEALVIRQGAQGEPEVLERLRL
jgi:hypothetical protein